MQPVTGQLAWHRERRHVARDGPGDAGTSLRDRFSLNTVNAESEPGAGELQRGARTPASLVVARQHPSEVHFPNLFQFSPRLVSVFLPHPLSFHFAAFFPE